MARFNLDDYETVESRIKRFTEAYPDGRIVTEWVNQYADQPDKARWVVQASVYLSAGDRRTSWQRQLATLKRLMAQVVQTMLMPLPMQRPRQSVGHLQTWR